MKQGIDRSLTLPHKKGRVTTVLKLMTPNDRQSLSVTSEEKGGKKKLESLLSFQDHLVGEKGPPPFFSTLFQSILSPESHYKACF